MQCRKKRRGRWAGLALLTICFASGCHVSDCYPSNKPTLCVCPPRGPCGGYFSTCWRQWPSECVACPPVMEASDVMPPAPPANETIPPPPRPIEMPYDGPATLPPEPASPSNDASPPDDSASGSRQGAAIEEDQMPPARLQPPRRQITLHVPQPDESVVYRQTTLELLQPVETTTRSDTEPSRLNPASGDNRR